MRKIAWEKDVTNMVIIKDKLLIKWLMSWKGVQYFCAIWSKTMAEGWAQIVWLYKTPPFDMSIFLKKYNFLFIYWVVNGEVVFWVRLTATACRCMQPCYGTAGLKVAQLWPIYTTSSHAHHLACWIQAALRLSSLGCVGICVWVVEIIVLLRRYNG